MLAMISSCFRRCQAATIMMRLNMTSPLRPGTYLCFRRRLSPLSSPLTWAASRRRSLRDRPAPSVLVVDEPDYLPVDQASVPTIR